MSRPQENRIVYALPLFSKFKPLGINEQDQIQLQNDEFEVFHLADHIGLSHATAADIMKISRSSFTRLIEKSRKKIADFLIQGICSQLKEAVFISGIILFTVRVMDI